MYSCCQQNFSSSNEYIQHRHNVHREWADKPYGCEGHPHDEAGKPKGNRTVLFTTEFCVFKHENSCTHNQQYLCSVVGEMTSVMVRRPPSKVNIPYGQSSAKLPVTQSLGHSVTQSLSHSVTWSLRVLTPASMSGTPRSTS